MSEFTKLINGFVDLPCTHNERLLFDAVCALITIVERQKQEIKRLDSEKEDRESFHG